MGGREEDSNEMMMWHAWQLRFQYGKILHEKMYLRFRLLMIGDVYHFRHLISRLSLLLLSFCPQSRLSLHEHHPLILRLLDHYQPSQVNRLYYKLSLYSNQLTVNFPSRSFHYYLPQFVFYFMQKTSNLRDFEVLSKLGEGAFGQVFRVKRRVDGKQYALKKVKIGAMKEKQRDNALNEIRILASYNDEYIIGYKEAFYDDTSGSLCVVMEFAEGGDILKRNQQHLKNRTKYKEEEIWRALVHMSLGLKSLHERKILHRDLKCANIFIASNNIYKLGDLNVSKVLKKDMAQTQTGTPYYASPEVWKDKPYGPKSDMWSLGCVLYEMAALRPPFVATDLQGLYKKVCAGLFERIPAVYSNDLATVISSLLKVDPDKRPSVEQLLASSVVKKHYDGKLQQSGEDEDDFDELLKTIKYNPRDLKGLKNILPKANYEQDVEKEKMKIEDMKGGIQSCKNARKEPSIKEEIKESLQNNDKRLADFLERKKAIEEKERQGQLKLLMEQKEELSKKRERVLSACGLRPPPNLYESPKVAVHSKNDLAPKVEVPMPSSTKNLRKEQQKPLNIKLPPKPQQNLNYKLPPKPSSHQMEIPYQKQSQRKPSTNQLDRVGSANRANRSNSAQKVIYPSWWG